MESLFATSIGLLLFIIWPASSLVQNNREVRISGCSYSELNQTFRCEHVYNYSIANLVDIMPNDSRNLHINGARFPNISIPRRQDNTLLRLKSFVCEHCGLEVISKKMFKNVPNLENINVSWNNIDSVSFAAFESLTLLQSLDFSHNAIAEVSNDGDATMPALTTLDLSHNNIHMLSSPRVFQCFPSLVNLDLSNNNMEYIHPATFQHLPNLRNVHLEFNEFESLPEQLFHNTSVAELNLGANPWDCHCGVGWLVRDLQNTGVDHIYTNTHNIRCNQPQVLSEMHVKDLNHSELRCEHPQLILLPEPTTALVWHTFHLHCYATGYPKPSIYWTGPRGVLVHKAHQQYLPADIHDASHKQTFAGYPTFREAVVRALRNGSLEFSNFRYNYAGNYTCHAANPRGAIQASAMVEIHSEMYMTMVWSVLFGAGSSLLFLIFGIVLGAVRMCVEKCCCRSCRDSSKTLYADELYEDEAEFWDEYFRHPLDQSRGTPDHFPSPVKCITPAEPTKHDLSDFNKGIFNTLVDARTRLTTSMGRHMDQMRARANTMRETRNNLRIDMNKKVERVRYKAYLMRESAGMRMTNFRESSTQTFKNIRSSSGQYAHRMREGMVVRVDAVKYSVKTLKEFCGSTNVAQTISVPSVSTNVDSQETEEVYRTVTFV